MNAPRPEAEQMGKWLERVFDDYDVAPVATRAMAVKTVVHLTDAALTAARADEREMIQREPHSEEWAALDEARDDVVKLRDRVCFALTRYEEMRQNVVAFGGGLRTEGFVKDCDEAMDLLAAAIRAMEGR